MANVTSNILAPDFDRSAAAQPKSRPGNRDHSDRFDRFLERPADDRPRDTQKTRQPDNRDQSDRARDAARADRERDIERADRARENDRAARARETDRDERTRKPERADRTYDNDRDNAWPAPTDRTAKERPHAERAGTQRDDPQPAERGAAERTSRHDRENTAAPADRAALSATDEPDSAPERTDTLSHRAAAFAPAAVDPSDPAAIPASPTDPSIGPAVTASEETTEHLLAPQTRTPIVTPPHENHVERIDSVLPLKPAEAVQTPTVPVDSETENAADLPAAKDADNKEVSASRPDQAPPSALPITGKAENTDLSGEQPAQPDGSKPAPLPDTRISGVTDDAPLRDARTRPPLPLQAFNGLENAESQLPEHYSGNGRPAEISQSVQPLPEVTLSEEDLTRDLSPPPDGKPLPIPPVSDGVETAPLFDTTNSAGEAPAELPDVAAGEVPSEEIAPVSADTDILQDAIAPLNDLEVEAQPVIQQPAEAPSAANETSTEILTAAPQGTTDVQPAPAAQPEQSAPAVSANATQAAPPAAPTATSAPAASTEALPTAASVNRAESAPAPVAPEKQAVPELAGNHPVIKEPVRPTAQATTASRPGTGLLQQIASPVSDTAHPVTTPVSNEAPQAPRINPFTQPVNDAKPAASQTQAPSPAANAINAAGPQSLPAAETSAPLPEPAVITSSSTATPTSDARTPVLPLPQNTTAVSIQFGTSPLATGSLQTPVNTIAFNIARNFDNGVTKFQVRIDPPELGRVDVKLDMTVEGRVQAHLTVERSETLDLMMRDARALEKALADTGLNLSKDSLSFSLKDQGNFDADGEMRRQDGEPEDGTDNQSLAENADGEATDGTMRGYISDTGVDISV